MFSLFILVSNDDMGSSHRWCAQWMWKRVHFSISDTVLGQHRRCWVMSCEERHRRRQETDDLGQGCKNKKTAASRDKRH